MSADKERLEQSSPDPKGQGLRRALVLGGAGAAALLAAREFLRRRSRSRDVPEVSGRPTVGPDISPFAPSGAAEGLGEAEDRVQRLNQGIIMALEERGITVNPDFQSPFGEEDPHSPQNVMRRIEDALKEGKAE